HEERAEVTARSAVSLVDQDENVAPQVDICPHVAKFVNHRHYDAAIILPLLVEELVESCNTVGVRDVGHSDGRKVLEHLIFEFVAVDHEQDGRLLRFVGLEEQLGRLDHRVCLAASLRMPDESTCKLRIENARNHPFYGSRLMLAQNDL